MKKWLSSVFLLLTLCSAAMGSTKTVRLRVLETSDVHGYFFPFDFVEGKPLQGSLVRVSTYANRLRQEYGNRLLLLENGDILQGQPSCYWSNFISTGQQNIAAQLVNYMGYDVQAVGNHDLETGHQVYDKWIHELRCPVVGANIVDERTGTPYVKPYTIIEREGVKIAVIGLLTPTIACWLNRQLWSGMEFEEMVSCARRWVQTVQQQEHPHVLIGLFHSGTEGGLTLPGGLVEDATLKVAREVPGFDVIFFGHDHKRHSEWVSNCVGDSVLTLNPACWALNVADAQIELTLDSRHKVVNKIIKGDVVSIRNEEVDRQMMSHFQQQADSIRQYVNRRIGRFEKGASTRDSYFGSSAFTDFIHNVQLHISGADLSFNAPLSFDSSISEGDATVADMFKLYRFENKYYIMLLTGSEIKHYLEESYARWVNTMKSPDDHLLLLSEQTRGDQQRMGFVNYTFNFDSAAGIDYEVDVTKPEGQRVRIIRMTDGRPFLLDETYKVVMNSYRGNGGGDLLTKGAGIANDELDGRIIYQSPLDMRYYIMKYIEEKGSVTPQSNNNWRFTPEAWTLPAARRDRQLLFKDE